MPERKAVSLRRHSRMTLKGTGEVIGIGVATLDTSGFDGEIR